MTVDFTDAGFYLEEVRSRHDIVKELQINTLPECEMVKDYYVIRLFDDGHSAIYNYKKNMYMKPHISCTSRVYWRYALQTNEQKPKFIRLHRMVALAFIDGYEEGFVVNHIDTERPREISQLDNRIENLEWVTQETNSQSDKRRDNPIYYRGNINKKLDKLLLSLTNEEREVLAEKLSF